MTGEELSKICLDLCVLSEDNEEMKKAIMNYFDKIEMCECTIPKQPDGNEFCRNKATHKCVLTEDFENDECYWCDECIELGKDMIKSKIKL